MVITSTTQYRVWHTVGRLNASGDCFTKFSDSEVSYFCTLTRSVKNIISSKCIFYNLQAKRAFQMKSMARGLSLSLYIYMYIYIYICMDDVVCPSRLTGKKIEIYFLDLNLRLNSGSLG